MPVFHFILHTYRSWTEDDEHGWIQHGQPAVQPPDSNLKVHRDKTAGQVPVALNFTQMNLVITSTRDIAQRRDWRVFGVAVVPNHAHVVISWKTDAEPEHVAAKLKNLIALALSRNKGTIGNRWFEHGEGKVRVIDIAHLENLLKHYLPKHLEEGGIVWIEPGV